MYLGDHVGALQQAGIPLKRTINEGNHRTWKQPVDPDGLWERALADPRNMPTTSLPSKGDNVWQAVQGRHLPELVEIHVTGQARAVRLSRPVITQVTLAPTNPMIKSGHRKSASGRPSSS